MATWKSEAIEVQGLRLHYTRTGGRLPPLVLAHGVGDDGSCWTTVAEALAPKFDVIMVDARGHGRSEAPLEGYDPITLATDLSGLIEALRLEHPIILGHSMGAVTALVLAAHLPEVPRAILLEDPPPWWFQTETTTADWDNPIAMKVAMGELKRKTYDELVAHQRSVAPTWPDAELERWAASKIRFSPHVLGLFKTRAEMDINWPSLLRRVICPVLLITGDPQAGSLVTSEHATALSEQLRQMVIEPIVGAGHSIRHDQFTQYIATVQEFLGSLK